jgi:DNA-binding XRE family transcriptional regulator
MVYLIAPAVRLWADTDEIAKKAMEALDVTGEPSTLTDTKYHVVVDGVKLNEELGNWGISCRGRGIAAAYMKKLGLEDFDIEYAAVRKPHKKTDKARIKRDFVMNAAPIVAERRKSMGWTQDDLAELVGISRSALCAYEKGKRMSHKWEKIFELLNMNHEGGFIERTEVGG